MSLYLTLRGCREEEEVARVRLVAGAPRGCSKGKALPTIRKVCAQSCLSLRR